MIELHGTKIQISMEGIVSVWQQFYVDSEREVPDVPKTYDSIAGSGRLDLVEISSAQAEEGKQHVVTAKYEGIAAERFVKPVYQWTPEEAQEPIKTNPNWKQLSERFAGKWDKDLQAAVWDEKIKVAKGKEVDNPMLGVTSWLDVAGLWTETKAHSEISEDVWDGMWSLVESVPGDLPTPAGRMWLVLTPRVEQRGACYSVTRQWKLTGVMTAERLEAARLIYTPVKA